MNERPRGQAKAYHNPGFLNSKDARALRMLAEYLEPKARFDYHRVEDTVVFMGSARIKSKAEAEELVRQAESGGGDLETARMALTMSGYYEAARATAGMPSCVAKQVTRPIRNREARVKEPQLA